LASASAQHITPPTPMIGQRLPSALRNCRMTRLLAPASGLPERPPASSACGGPATASRATVVLVAMTPSIRLRLSVAALRPRSMPCSVGSGRLSRVA